MAKQVSHLAGCQGFDGAILSLNAVHQAKGDGQSRLTAHRMYGAHNTPMYEKEPCETPGYFPDLSVGKHVLDLPVKTEKTRGCNPWPYEVPSCSVDTSPPLPRIVGFAVSVPEHVPPGKGHAAPPR